MKPSFDESEIKTVEDFFGSNVGKKVLAALDNEAEEKNNLLHTVNLTSGVFNPEHTGIRCQMSAAEVRTLKQVVENLKTFGDSYAR